MSYPFAAAFRNHIAGLCAGFPRIAYDGGDVKRSAVAITLMDAGDGSGETAFLLTKRAPKLRTHAGQWALPGGRCDEGETLPQTALRELHEELGLRLDEGQVLGVLDDYVSRSGYAIAPVVTWLEDAGALAPNPAEVASVHRIRLDQVGRDDAVEFLTIPESERPVIRMRIGERHVHAPTAALIYQIRELAAGRVTGVAHLEQPVFAWR
jgi:8-oxo-dGTP pyrophosphatase MutT (NUDIX family)